MGSTLHAFEKAALIGVDQVSSLPVLGNKFNDIELFGGSLEMVLVLISACFCHFIPMHYIL